MSQAATTASALTALLEEARARGFLGPGPVQAHIDLALEGLSLVAPGMAAADLGSGGGALGLPLAVFGPPVAWAFIEASATRADFLRRAIGRLDLDQGTRVLARPAEDVGRLPEERGTFDLVVARSFGSPATTAECAAPLLRVGGILAVTEPPDSAAAGPGSRWPSAGLDALGLAVRARVGSFQTFEQVSSCPSSFPRRVGVPRRRPLF
ncbi:MAG TPA: RsmG family class I SAM-dependent methyltransferase [Acidimicrobiales bacterium]|nr:RsmG family class I SAM-dependent methyltransferase [Acidimicrobiales bacterium]